MPPELHVDDIAWAPPEWTLCGFPLEEPGDETIQLESVMDVLHRLADTITDADSTALGPAMHVAHMLVTRQGRDGKWPARWNARTGEIIGIERTEAPLSLYQRLIDLLDTTEFDYVIAAAQSAH